MFHRTAVALCAGIADYSVNPAIRAEVYPSVVESCFTCDLEAGLTRAEAGEAFALSPEMVQHVRIQILVG
jgi:hypothetical protein